MIVSLSRYIDRAREIARARDGQKAGFASSRYWADESPHLVGLLGEITYAIEFREKVKADLLIQGDGGVDFPGVDVKTSTIYRDPWLKHPPDAKHWPELFCLVAVDLTRLVGRVCGFATCEMVRSAQLRDWGHGPQLSIPESGLLRSKPEV